MSFVIVCWHIMKWWPLYVAQLCKWHSYGQTRSFGLVLFAKKHFIYRKTAQKQKTGGKMSKNLPKNFFFQPLLPAGWVWLKLCWHSFSLAATVAVQFQAETLPNTVWANLIHLAGGHGKKEGCWLIFVLFFASSLTICIWKGYFEKKTGLVCLFWPQEPLIQSSAAHQVTRGHHQLNK